MNKKVKVINHFREDDKDITYLIVNKIMNRIINSEIE